MKILRLYLNKTQYVGTQTSKVEDVTHDIRPGPHGCYLAVHRSTGLGYLVHASSCVAEVRLPEEDQADDAADGAPAAGAVPRRAGASKKPPTVPPV